MNFYALYLDVGHDNITLELEALSRNMISWICYALALWFKGCEFKPCYGQIHPLFANFFWHEWGKCKQFWEWKGV